MIAVYEGNVSKGVSVLIVWVEYKTIIQQGELKRAITIQHATYINMGEACTIYISGEAMYVYWEHAYGC